MWDVSFIPLKYKAKEDIVYVDFPPDEILSWN